MKVEIEIPDMEDILYTHDGEYIKGEDFKEALVNIAIDKFIDEIYDNYMNDKVYSSIQNQIKDLIKNHEQEIIDSVIKRTSELIEAKRKIVSEMPKKSEIVQINKEWENYFIELIDKAIAKRFK